MRPVIGVTMSFSDEMGSPPRPRAYLNAAYTDAVLAAGGLPMPIPIPREPDPDLIAAMLRRCDGLLFTGGEDLDPRHYGQPKHPQTSVMAARRDAFELPLFKAADASGLPTLCICLGCQIAGVARGGCLIQHVDDLPATPRIVHHMPDFTSAYHPVRVRPESRLARIVGATHFEVNSRHHQVLKPDQTGDGLHAVAFAPDETVEAIEAAGDRFLIAVQWHPEDLIDRQEHFRLFTALVTAAGSA